MQTLRPRAPARDLARAKQLRDHPDYRLRGTSNQLRRKRLFTAQPLCVHCEAVGRTTIATEIDHIIPIAAGGADADHNLQPLCHDCHARKTATERATGRG
jgi:5-methylcytosine-specific restriction protein A